MASKGKARPYGRSTKPKGSSKIHVSRFSGPLSLPDDVQNSLCQHHRMWIQQRGIKEGSLEITRSSIDYVHELHSECMQTGTAGPFVKTIRNFFHKKWFTTTKTWKDGRRRKTPIKKCPIKSIIRVRLV